MKAVVDKNQRTAKARAHTATHLLHKELLKLISNTKQSWSLVDEDYIRFDFTAKEPLNNEQIKQIEQNINEIIYKSMTVEKQEMSLDKALKIGAKAFFEEKYWETVRVVTITDYKEDKQETISIELCGWTHLDNTWQIWAFKIIWQEAVASGIRRIMAYTWPKTYQYCLQTENLLEEISEKLKCSTKQINEKIEKIQNELEQYKSNYDKLKNNLIQTYLLQLKWVSSEKFDIISNITDIKQLQEYEFKDIANEAKQTFTDKNIILFNEAWNFVIFVWRWDINAKEFAKEKWLKWWWSDTFVQWKDEKIKTI